MTRERLLRLVRPSVTAGVLVALATVAIAVLEAFPGVPNASSVYVVAVAGTAIVAGTGGAVFAATVAVVLYDFLFTNPRHTLVIADPGEWLNLVLLLFVAVTVGQLAALQRRRAEVALAREHETRALVQVTWALATRQSTEQVLPAIAASLAAATGSARVAFAFGADDASERISGSPGRATPRPGAYAVLHRAPGDQPPAWTLVHAPVPADASQRGQRLFRVRLEAAGRTLGSIWCAREREAGAPGAAATRLLATAADQVAQATANDQLADQARMAEIARQSDALKSALLDSVSHDLRTPLSSIRAHAGTLMDPEVALSSEEARSSAAAIDREAERLNRLVTNLLDLSRIEGGAIRVSREPLDVEDVVTRVVRHVEPRAGRRDITVDLPDPLVVSADPVLLEEALINLLENAVRHTPDGIRVRIAARRTDGQTLRVTVEDSGPGVPSDVLARLFDKFYRSPRARQGSRAGSGIGLAVARGLVEAMGGRAAARRSELGGLAVDVELPEAASPATADAQSALPDAQSAPDGQSASDGQSAPAATPAGSA